MKAFVDTQALSILTTGDVASSFGGPWGRMLDAGTAVWIDVPAGEIIDDCDLSPGTPPVLVVNATRKAARLAKQTKAAALAQNLKDDDPTALFPTLTAPQQNFLNRLRRAAVLAMKNISSED